MVHQTVIAVRDEDLNQEAGRVVYWSIHGDINLAILTANVGNLLAPEMLPPKRGPQQVFTAAVKSMEERRLLARPLANRAGIAIVREEEGDQTNAYHTLCTAHLHTCPVGVVSVETTPHDHPLREEIQRRFDSQMNLLPSSKVGAWLVTVAEEACDGVSLRPSGGFYFIPRHAVGVWKAVSDALRPLGVETFQIPAVTSEDAVRAVSAAVTREAQVLLDEVGAALEAGTLGARALTNREGDLKIIESKMKLYENLLGVSLDGVRDKLEDVQANLAAAALTRLSDEE